jgi:uncharacterized protein (TIGR02246 family)
MKRPAIMAASALLVLAATTILLAEDKIGDAQKQAIEKVVASLQAAFNAGDAKAMAALWTPQGELIDIQGDHIEGRDAIEKQFGEFLAANKQAKMQIAIASIRMVSDDVAIVGATTEVTPPLRGIPAEPQATIVLVRRDGQWFIETARDTLVYVPSNYRRLKDIEGLVGQWTDNPSSPADAKVHSTCDWTINKNFLIRKYTIGGKSHLAFAGTEVIGWDPRQHTIRAWNFDSNGGFGESTWTRDGDRWVIQHSGVLLDGSKVSATYVLSRIDNDTVSLTTKDRKVDGQLQPGESEVKLYRVKPGKEGAAAEKEKPVHKPLLP